MTPNEELLFKIKEQLEQMHPLEGLDLISRALAYEKLKENISNLTEISDYLTQQDQLRKKALEEIQEKIQSSSKNQESTDGNFKKVKSTLQNKLKTHSTRITELEERDIATLDSLVSLQEDINALLRSTSNSVSFEYVSAFIESNNKKLVELLSLLDSYLKPEDLILKGSGNIIIKRDIEDGKLIFTIHGSTPTVLVSGGGGGANVAPGATAFTSLSDAPNSYVGQAGLFVRVKGDESGLEFATEAGLGDVTGPASATDNHVVFFNGATGKVIKDSGLTLSGTNTGDQDLSGYATIASLGDLAFLDTITASLVTDFDTEVSNNTDVAANTAARHAAITVVDSSEIDFTLTGQQITAVIVAGSIDELKLDTSVNASLDLADSALQSSAIGVTIQAYDATLTSIALLGTAADRMIYTTDVDTWAEQTTAAYGRSLLTPANDVAARVLLGLGTLATLSSIDISTNTNLAVTAPITLTGDTIGIDQSLLSITASQVSDFTSASQTVGDARYLKLDASNDPLTGTLAIDINSDSNLIKLVNNGTQTNAVLVQRNSGDSGNLAGLNGNGRWMSVGSTSTGFAITSSDFTTTAHLVMNHTTVVGSIVNNTGSLSVEGFATSEIVINNLGADVDFRIEGDTDTSLFRTDAGLETVGIGVAPVSLQKFTVTQSTGVASNSYTIVANGTQTVGGAATFRVMQFNANTSHTSLTLSGINAIEGNLNLNGNGGTTSTAEGFNIIASIGTGHTASQVNYIHLYDANVNGTLNGLTGILIENLDSIAGAYAIRVQGGLVVFNDIGGDYDFRVEGDTNSSLIHVDASADTVQINATTASDSAKFYVSGKISTSGEMEINGDLNHDGTNIGLYSVAPVARATTGGAASTFVTNTSLIANDTGTWDGYTIGQVVKALRNIGILT